MTNGEKIKVTFPHYDIEIEEHKGYVRVFYEDFYTTYPLRWWNAEYKEPTTKNDLGVDWENYKDADGNCLDDLILEVLQNNFDCGNTYGYKVADEIIGLLPSVTPQEPKTGQWIIYNYPGHECVYCSSCKEEYYEEDLYMGGSDFPKYCPNCGCAMVEPQESEKV